MEGSDDGWNDLERKTTPEVASTAFERWARPIPSGRGSPHATRRRRSDSVFSDRGRVQTTTRSYLLLIPMKRIRSKKSPSCSIQPPLPCTQPLPCPAPASLPSEPRQTHCNHHQTPKTPTLRHTSPPEWHFPILSSHPVSLPARFPPAPTDNDPTQTQLAQPATRPFVGWFRFSSSKQISETGNCFIHRTAQMTDGFTTRKKPLPSIPKLYLQPK